MYIRHEPSCFFTIIGVVIKVGKIASRRMLAPTSFAISSFIVLLLLPTCPFFFCLTRTLPEKMFKLCSTTLCSTSFMYTGSQENTLDNYFKSVINLVLVYVYSSAPTCTACSRWSGWITCFSLRHSSFDFFGARISYEAAIIWWQTFWRGVLAAIVAEPIHMLNLTVSWMVDSMACNWKSAGRLTNMFFSVGKWIIENLIICVMLSFPWWLTSIRGGVWYLMAIGYFLWNWP